MTFSIRTLAIKSTLLIFFILFCTSLQAQNKRAIDSLEKVLKTTGIADTTKTNTYRDLCWEYIFTDMAKAISYGKLELELATKINNKKAMGQAHHDMGSVLVAWSKFPESREEFYKALEIRKSIGDKRNTSATLVNLSTIENYLGNYSSALNLNFESLKIFEELNEQKSVCSILGNIGSIYYSINNNKKALEFNKKAYDIAKQNSYLTDLAGDAMNLGNLHVEIKDYSQAEKYFMESLELFKKLNENSKIGTVLNGLGHFYMKVGNNKKALETLTQGLKFSTETDNVREQASSLVELGNVNVILKNNSQAEKFYLSGIELSRKNGLRSPLKNGLENLSKLYESQGDFKKSLLFFHQLALVNDTLLNEKGLKAVAEMQTKYETEKKEKENIELKQKNEVQQLLTQTESSKRKTQLAISFGFTSLLVVSALFVYNRKKLMQEAVLASEIANQEKMKFTAIMEAEQKERARIAQELHDGLGQMLSTTRLNVSALIGSVEKEDEPVLDTSLRIIDQACEEVRNISHNMMPSALIRLGLIPAIEEMVSEINNSNQIKVELISNINHRLNENKEMAAYRVIQEVTNNMIKHAEATKIRLSLNIKNDEIKLVISDNGKGFDVSTVAQSKGLGWKSIQSRVDMINGKLSVSSSSQDGTRVDVNFPS